MGDCKIVLTMDYAADCQDQTECRDLKNMKTRDFV